MLEKYCKNYSGAVIKSVDDLSLIHIYAVTKQEVSIVADVAGTTTDPVYKPMEIHPLLSLIHI